MIVLFVNKLVFILVIVNEWFSGINKSLIFLLVFFIWDIMCLVVNIKFLWFNKIFFGLLVVLFVNIIFVIFFVWGGNILLNV